AALALAIAGAVALRLRQRRLSHGSCATEPSQAEAPGSGGASSPPVPHAVGQRGPPPDGAAAGAAGEGGSLRGLEVAAEEERPREEAEEEEARVEGSGAGGTVYKTVLEQLTAGSTSPITSRLLQLSADAATLRCDPLHPHPHPYPHSNPDLPAPVVVSPLSPPRPDLALGVQCGDQVTLLPVLRGR
ncbi:hypothetical protein Agub_g4794, partial [Astrephomene gubernaculifera]